MPLEPADFKVLSEFYDWAEGQQLDFKIRHKRNEDRWTVTVDGKHIEEEYMAQERGSLRYAIISVRRMFEESQARTSF